jgi:hypothetical protein
VVVVKVGVRAGSKVSKVVSKMYRVRMVRYSGGEWE